MILVCSDEKGLALYLYKGCSAKIDSLGSKGSNKYVARLTEKHHDKLIPIYCERVCAACKTCHKSVKDKVLKDNTLFQSEWYRADE